MMKTFARILALTLVAVMLCGTLAACGGVPSGEYYAGDKDTTKSYTLYSFSGSKVTFSTYVLGEKIDSATLEGKYKVDGDEIIFTWIDANGKETTDTKAFAKNEDGTLKIGLLTYTKIEK
ncbi:MAG: hypothetical protein IKC75_04115 [Clostridia bacterium]|nr:hypothetical protein [Clostridia bacterium]